MKNSYHRYLSSTNTVSIPNRTDFFKVIFIWIFCLVVLSAPAQAEELSSQVNLSTAVAQVAKQNIPAVVHIEVT